jgi:hypothetical protein
VQRSPEEDAKINEKSEEADKEAVDAAKEPEKQSEKEVEEQSKPVRKDAFGKWDAASRGMGLNY